MEGNNGKEKLMKEKLTLQTLSVALSLVYRRSKINLYIVVMLLGMALFLFGLYIRISELPHVFTFSLLFLGSGIFLYSLVRLYIWIFRFSNLLCVAIEMAFTKAIKKAEPDKTEEEMESNGKSKNKEIQ